MVGLPKGGGGQCERVLPYFLHNVAGAGNDLGDDFAAAAVKNGVAVEIVADPDDIRALDMAQAPGYQRWQDTNLADLVEDMES